MVQTGGRAQTEAEIRHVGPVAVVVAAGEARLCVVADFVALVAVMLRQLLRDFIIFHHRVLVGERQTAALTEPVEGRSLFNNKVINRDVLGLQHEHIF